MKKLTLLILSVVLLLTTIIPTVYASNNDDISENDVIGSTLPNAEGKFELQPLPYEKNALEPSIDTETMTLHHDKHEQAYINNLNAALEKAPTLKGKSLEELLSNPKDLPKDLRTTILNNAGGVYNHEFFWHAMDPNGGGKPGANIGDAIEKQFGSFDNFKSEFEKAGLGVFGSGWVWLLSDSKGNLTIATTPNQGTPIPLNKKPIIAIDLWEHAYYLKYQNRRAEYISAFWNIANWNFAEDNYIGAMKK